MPAGIGSPLPDLAEAADLTIAQAQRAILQLEAERKITRFRRLASVGTIDLFSRAAA